MEKIKCPKCNSFNVDAEKDIACTFKCKDCRFRFIKCPKCGRHKVVPITPFDYAKQCEDCGYEFTTGEHN